MAKNDAQIKKNRLKFSISTTLISLEALNFSLKLSFNKLFEVKKHGCSL